MADAITNGNWRDATNLTPREDALCTVAEKLSATPARMTEEDWQPLRDLGFNDKACLEVAHIVGLFNYFVRLADGFGLMPTEYADNLSPPALLSEAERGEKDNSPSSLRGGG